MTCIRSYASSRWVPQIPLPERISGHDQNSQHLPGVRHEQTGGIDTIRLRVFAQTITEVRNITIDAVHSLSLVGRYYQMLQAFQDEQAEASFLNSVKKALPGIVRENRVSKKRVINIVAALRKYTIFEEKLGGAKRLMLAGKSGLDETKWAINLPNSLIILRTALLALIKHWTGHPGGFTDGELIDWIRKSWKDAYEWDCTSTMPERHAKRDSAFLRKELCRMPGTLRDADDVDSGVFDLGSE